MQLEMFQLDLRFEGLRVRATPEAQARLVASLAQDGQQSPILVVRDAGCFVVIDGYARVRAVESLAWDTVDALLVEVAVSEALIITHRMEVKRRRTAIEEGWLIAELLSGQGMSMRAIATRLHRSVSWVSRRASLAIELPAGVQAAVLTGQVPPRGAARYLTVLARAHTQHCEHMVAALDRPVSDRELECLYLGWHRANPEERERIVSNPMLFLKAAKAARPAPKLPRGDPAQPLVNALDTITDLARRERRRVRDGLLGELDEGRIATIRSVATSCEQAFDSLIQLLPKEGSCSTEIPAPPS